MQRYFVKELNIKNRTATISGQDVHHIRNVMRFKVGDNIVLNSYSGQVFLCQINSITKSTVICDLIEEIENIYKPMNLTLGMSLIKKDKFELVLQKATELGVKAILPIKADNSIVKINDFSNKYDRYISIVKEASEQCERTVLPEIEEPLTLKEIDYNSYDLIIVAYAREDTENRLSDIINVTNKDKNVLLIIGPEGGLSDSEVEYLKTKSVIFKSLGNTILRAETAAIYIISAFKLYWEN